MSFLTSRLAAAAPTLRPLVAVRRPLVLPLSSFHTSSARRVMSENDHHHDDAQRRDDIDRHKEDALKKQKDGKGEWKRELASTSEAAVKADRDEIAASEENIKKLQEETVEYEKKAGRS